MKFKLLCCAVVSTLLASAAMAAPAFYGKARECKIEVLDYSFPKQFGVGDFFVSMRIKNAGQAALRGSLIVESVDAKGGSIRIHGSKGIDLPPPSVSDIQIDLEIKDKLGLSDLARTVKVWLRTNMGEVLCFEGPICEKAIGAERKAAAENPTSKFARNYEVKFADRLPEGEGAKWRKFIENGGVLIIPNIASDADFAGAAEFCEKKYLPVYRSQRLPTDFRSRPVLSGPSPYLDWPNRLSEAMQPSAGRFHLSGNSQVLGAYTYWEQVQQGYTVMMRIGNGLLMLSTQNLANTEKLRENILANLKLYECGYGFERFNYDFNSEDGSKGKSNYPTTAGGLAWLRMFNTSKEPSRKINVALRVTLTALDGSRRSRTFVSRRRQNLKPRDTIDLRVGLPVLPAEFQGEWNLKAEYFEWDGTNRWVIDERKLVFADLVEIIPPDYRATVSTERREECVRIGIRANRVNLDMGGKKWKLSAAEEKSGKVVAKAEGTFTEGTRFAEVELPVARNASAGKYLLTAEVETPCDGVKVAKSEFFIVKPEKGQIIVDQDGFLLNEGKPYFPLGIYHVTAEEWKTPIDESGLKPADMGFNWRQMWGDEWMRSYSLDRADVGKFVNAKLTGAEREKVIDAMLVTNQANRAALKDVAVCLEAFNFWNSAFFEKPGETGRYSYELDPEVAAKVKEIANDDSHLVRMWHLANRCGDERYRELRYTSDWISKHDAKFHPVMNLGVLSANMAGDIGGDRIFMRHRGEVGDARIYAEQVAKLRSSLAPFNRRPFMVVQAIGVNGQRTESLEWVRAQAYLSLINGANGLAFYCWRETGNHGRNLQGMGWNPPTAYAVKKIIEEVKVFQAALRTPGQKNLVSNDGNVIALLCGDGKSGRYLIAASTLEAPVDTVLPVPGISGMKLEPMFGAPKAECSGGFMGLGKSESISVRLPALGTAVWRLK